MEVNVLKMNSFATIFNTIGGQVKDIEVSKRWNTYLKSSSSRSRDSFGLCFS